MSCSGVLRRLGLSRARFVAGYIVRVFETERYALVHKHSLSTVLCRGPPEQSSLSFSIANFSSNPSSNVDIHGIIDEGRSCADQSDDHDTVEETPELFPFEMQVKRRTNITYSKRSYHLENIDGLVSRPSPVIGKENKNNRGIEDHNVAGDEESPSRPGIPPTINVCEQEGDRSEFCCSNDKDDLVSDISSYSENNEPIKKMLSYKAPGFREEVAEGFHHKHKHEVGWQGERFYLLKNRGQHILTNPRVLDSIIQKAKVLPTDTVLEVGPGTGNLTIRLLECARKVIAVEIDERMIETLQNRISKLGLEDKLSVIKGNVLKMELPHFDICVSNIPYGISSPLIAKLFLMPHETCFRSATLLLQKEFARRLLAKPGESDFNRLAVNVGLVASTKFLMKVSKKEFVPCPKVDSSLVQIQPKPNIPDINLDEWSGFTRTCFSTRNKTLYAIFKQKKKIIELYEKSQSSGLSHKPFDCEDHASDFDIDGDNESENSVGTRNLELEGQNSTEILSFKDKIVRILKDGGFGEKRPSKLSNEDFLCLLNFFNKEGVFFH